MDKMDFKDLWKKQSAEPPKIEDLISSLKDLKKAGLRKIILANVLLIATCVFIASVWFNYQPQLLSTKLGIILMILAMVIFLISYNQLFASFRTIDADQDNSRYLQNLIAIKTKQQFVQSTMLNLYFILLSIGIGMAMYEYTLVMTRAMAILAYGATAAWIAFNWFYTRPKTIKKQQAKIEELITKFESINKQLQGDAEL